MIAGPPVFHLAGVMGWPVMHSRSPLIHNHWFEQHGLAGRYVPLAIEPAGLAAALRALPALRFAGCNLTLPHKERALEWVDEVDAAARQIGAVNCVQVRADGSLLGCNTDAEGFVRNLRQQQPGWRADAGPAVVVGAGGGARAVCFGLLAEGVREVRVVNRTLARAQEVGAALGAVAVHAVPWTERAQALADAALVVNTTSLGMEGQAPLDLPLQHLPASAVVSDIVYVPLITPLLAAARDRGNPVVTGLGMLLHQAVPAWKRWFGIEPEVTPALQALVEATLQPKA